MKIIVNKFLFLYNIYFLYFLFVLENDNHFKKVRSKIVIVENNREMNKEEIKKYISEYNKISNENDENKNLIKRIMLDESLTPFEKFMLNSISKSQEEKYYLKNEFDNKIRYRKNSLIESITSKMKKICFNYQYLIFEFNLDMSYYSELYNNNQKLLGLNFFEKDENNKNLPSKVNILFFTNKRILSNLINFYCSNYFEKNRLYECDISTDTINTMTINIKNCLNIYENSNYSDKSFNKCKGIDYFTGKLKNIKQFCSNAEILVPIKSDPNNYFQNGSNSFLKESLEIRIINKTNYNHCYRYGELYNSCIDYKNSDKILIKDKDYCLKNSNVLKFCKYNIEPMNDDEKEICNNFIFPIFATDTLDTEHNKKFKELSINNDLNVIENNDNNEKGQFKEKNDLYNNNSLTKQYCNNINTNIKMRLSIEVNEINKVVDKKREEILNYERAKNNQTLFEYANNLDNISTSLGNSWINFYPLLKTYSFIFNKENKKESFLIPDNIKEEFIKQEEYEKENFIKKQNNDNIENDILKFINNNLDFLVDTNRNIINELFEYSTKFNFTNFNEGLILTDNLIKVINFTNENIIEAIKFYENGSNIAKKYKSKLLDEENKESQSQEVSNTRKSTNGLDSFKNELNDNFSFRQINKNEHVRNFSIFNNTAYSINKISKSKQFKENKMNQNEKNTIRKSLKTNLYDLNLYNETKQKPYFNKSEFYLNLNPKIGINNTFNSFNNTNKNKNNYSNLLKGSKDNNLTLKKNFSYNITENNTFDYYKNNFFNLFRKGLNYFFNYDIKTRGKRNIENEFVNNTKLSMLQNIIWDNEINTFELKLIELNTKMMNILKSFKVLKSRIINIYQDNINQFEILIKLKNSEILKLNEYKNVFIDRLKQYNQYIEKKINIE